MSNHDEPSDDEDDEDNEDKFDQVMSIYGDFIDIYRIIQNVLDWIVRLILFLRFKLSSFTFESLNYMPFLHSEIYFRKYFFKQN